ncbi:MAG: hypothetical protein ACTSUT_00020 [Promethearchaeota archaeon]
MIRRTKYDENFFVKKSKEILIDSSLPFKLQKRELLKKLRFPLDDNVLVLVQDQKKTRLVYREYVKKIPFLIGIHLKSMTTHITPFFLIGEDKIIKYRDGFGGYQIISQEEMFNKINKFSSQHGWLEFTDSIWNPTTIAGRIIYFSSIEQLIEIQKGVVSSEIGGNREKFPYLTAKLLFFSLEFQEKNNLSNLGFKKIEVDSLIFSLKKYRREFEILKRIDNLPTLEFGYTVKNGLTIVDIDWPGQYSISM